ESNGLDALRKLCGKLQDLPISFVRVLSNSFAKLCRHTRSQVSLEGGSKAQILSLLDDKPMPALAALIARTDQLCVIIALCVIRKLLSVVNGPHLDTLKGEAKAAGVVEHIKNVMENSLNQVRNLAKKIRSEFFAADGE
ncbi:hypothetical protein PMAYCL1PPCAC_26475, partial [Pristionchus mayeri]